MGGKKAEHAKEVFKPSRFAIKTLDRIIASTDYSHEYTDENKEKYLQVLTNNEDLFRQILAARFPAATPVSEYLANTDSANTVELGYQDYLLFETDKEYDSTSRNPEFRGTTKTYYSVYWRAGASKRRIAYAQSGTTRYSTKAAEAKEECKMRAMLYFLQHYSGEFNY